MKGRKERMRRRRKRALPDNPGNPLECKGGKKNNVKCKVTWLLTPKGTALKVGTKVRMCVVHWVHSELTWTVIHLELNPLTRLRLHISIQMYLSHPCSKVRIQTMSVHTLTTPGWHMNDLLLGLHPIPLSLRTPEMLLRMLSHLFIISFFESAPPPKPSNELQLTVTTRAFLLRSQGFLNEGGEKEGRLLSSQIKSQSASQRIKQIRTPRGRGLQ